MSVRRSRREIVGVHLSLALEGDVPGLLIGSLAQPDVGPPIDQPFQIPSTPAEIGLDHHTNAPVPLAGGPEDLQGRVGVH
jgi:hypothetical protein